MTKERAHPGLGSSIQSCPEGVQNRQNATFSFETLGFERERAMMNALHRRLARARADIAGKGRKNWGDLIGFTPIYLRGT